MSKNDAYTAGLFDGEGTVTLMRAGSSFRVPFVEMSSTSYELLDYLKIHYGGTIVNHKTYKSHHKKSWNWRLTNRRAIEFLEQIRSFLLDERKKARTDLILSCYVALTPRNGKYTDKQREAKSQFEDRFFAL